MLKLFLTLGLSLSVFAYSEEYKCENNKIVIYMKSKTKTHSAYIVHCDLDYVKCNEFKLWQNTKCLVKINK